MNWKLTLTIVFLLLIQISVYIYVNQNEEKINKIVESEEVIQYAEEIEEPVFEYLSVDGVLDLSNQGIRNLEFVPNFIWEDENIHTVILNNNSLTEFPTKVMRLPNLERLYLNDNLIKTVDFKSIYIQNESLVVLEIANNDLFMVENIGNLSKLRFLNLSNNRIFKTPHLQLESLEDVNLENNHIQYFNIAHIHNNLNTINLNQNYLNTIEVRVEDSSDYKLTKLSIQDNMIMEFPNEIFHLPNLVELQVSNQELHKWDFPEYLSYQTLETFNLDKHQLTSFDFPINQTFPSLKSMTVKSATLDTIFIQHDKIESLEIAGNENTQVKINAKNLKTLKMPIEYVNPNLNIPNLTDLILVKEESISFEKMSYHQRRFPNVDIQYKTK